MGICCLSGLPHDRHFSAVTYGAMHIFLDISVKVRREVLLFVSKHNVIL